MSGGGSAESGGSAEPPRVGERVLIEGTGRWWSGSRFVAVISEFDPQGDTVKVRFSDGGFKRFARADFVRLVAHAHSYHEENIEPMHEETIAGEVGEGTAVERRLTTRINAGHDLAPKLAAELRRHREKLRMDQEALQDAIGRRDFLHAHEIDQRIRAVEARLAELGMLEAPAAQQSEMLRASLKKALGGGFTGAAAMAVQVVSLMWLRTTLYYQCTRTEARTPDLPHLSLLSTRALVMFEPLSYGQIGTEAACATR